MPVPPPNIPPGTLDTAALVAAGADHLLTSRREPSNCHADEAKALRVVVAQQETEIRRLREQLMTAERREVALDGEVKRLQATPAT